MIALETILDSLAVASWKGSLLIATILLLHTLLRDRVPAGWRHALLLVGFIRLVMPVAPASSFSIFNLAQPQEAGPQIQVTRNGAKPFLAFTTAPARPPAAPAREPLSPTSLTLLAIWAAGALIVAGRVVHRSRLVSNRLTDVEPVVREDILALVDEARDALGVNRRVSVATTPSIDSPSLHGWLRPTLLLPPHVLRTFSPDQLRFVFLHEIAHLRRSDVPVNWFIAAVHALHWFNPLVWFAVSRLAEERELACDALALEHLRPHERTAYGDTVLRLLDQFRTAPLVPVLVGMSSTHSQMKRRILMIARFRNRSRYSVLFAAAVVAVGIVSLTDASARERTFIRTLGEARPHFDGTMKQLDVAMDLDLPSASFSDITNAISNHTGVAITVAPDALDADALAARISIKAKSLPAHLVLLESAAALGLAVKFEENAVTVVKNDDRHEIFTHIVTPPLAGVDGRADVIFIDKDRVETSLPDLKVDDVVTAESKEGKRVVVRKFDLRTDAQENKDGVVRRKLNFHGGEEGQVGGTLELEVQKTPATSVH